jgi:hypothetical protein
MDRTKLEEFFKIWNGDAYIGKTANGTQLVFARQHMSDVEEIEKMSDQELVDEWKSLVWLDEIIGQVSLNEMQRIQLLEFEMSCRKMPNEPLNVWFETEKKKWEENEQVI